MTEYLVRGFNGRFYVSGLDKEDIESRCNEDGFCDEIVLDWNIVLDEKEDYETMIKTIASYLLEFFTINEEILTAKLNKYIVSEDTDLNMYFTRFKDTLHNEYESAVEFVQNLLDEIIINQDDALKLFEECKNLLDYQMDIVSKLDLSTAAKIITDNKNQEIARKKAIASKGSITRLRRKNSK
ncbi:MAG: hypothetical protein K6G37_00735 [Bacilli bacterium]|nr:hypothetical protein [Bacilli bacterium]